MQSDVIRSDDAHHVGEPATRPLSGRRIRLASLLLFAMPRHDRRRALPAGFSTPPSDGFLCCFKDEWYVGMRVICA